MKRRKFINTCKWGMIGVGIAPLLVNCTDDILEISETNEDLLLTKSGMSDPVAKDVWKYIKRSLEGNYDQYPDIYYQRRILYIVKDYKLVTDPVKCKEKDADYLLRLTLLAVIHCNFDIYRFKSELVNPEQINLYTTYFTTSLPGQEIRYTLLPHTPEMEIVLKIDTSKNELAFDKYYRLPCIMTDEEAKKMFKEKSVSNLNLL